MLISYVRLLDHWWASTAAARDAAWADPWEFREPRHRGDGRGRTGRLADCVLAHPTSFTSVLRRTDRERIVEALTEHLPSPSGDTERDLKTITLALQAEQGGAPVRYDTAPLLRRWSQDPEGIRAWLVRGELDQQNRVPAWLDQGLVTLTVGRLTQLPGELTQDALTNLVEDRYSDLQVVKREAKKRDVSNFVFGMKAGDLVATDDGGHLQMAHLDEGQPALDSYVAATRVHDELVVLQRANWQDCG